MVAITPISSRDRTPAGDDRLIDAALRCVARWGVAKTTLDDVARDAGVSRATVYRAFPGGREALVQAVVASEVSRFFDALLAHLDAADSLEDAIVTGITFAGRAIRDHDALQYLLAHEPELILPALAFSRMDALLRLASTTVAPSLARFLPDTDEATRVAEWVTRIAISYTISPAAGVDTADEVSVRRLVRTFVLPGLVPATADL
ncbi:MAG TPA: TetR/AcrR family transcriptional regulator [Acidimicrobiales bacterium]|nr:TetR/AcrR family transcriptional regulator [Acidimicrobiales bacterium]